MCVPVSVCVFVLAQSASYGGVKHVARREGRIEQANLLLGRKTTVLSAALDQKFYDNAMTLTQKQWRNKKGGS